jgi:hypothetical protein
LIRIFDFVEDSAINSNRLARTPISLKFASLQGGQMLVAIAGRWSLSLSLSLSLVAVAVAVAGRCRDRYRHRFRHRYRSDITSPVFSSNVGTT